ncbi:aminoacetone oxidase family FAD-binding enzyme, partial [Aeromonas hydrophila]
GFKLAEQFGLKVLPTRAGLVPFTLHQAEKEAFADLAGVSLPVAVTAEDGTCFKEAMLFTHRGLSGPAILQISSFWLAGEKIHINLLPELDIAATLRAWAQAHPAQELKTVLGRELPKRFVDKLVELGQLVSKPMRQYNERELEAVAALLGDWQILPNGTEGYRTAEVTLGGVDTNELSSKTMEARKVASLYFIGEVVDVTGWLGGYNFQWAWSSGWVAGQYC